MTELRLGTPAEARLDEAGVDRVRRLCQSWVDEEIHPAIVVLVARHGVIALHEAFGRAGPEPDAPPTEVGTVFRMMSISKVFTATAVMMLVEDGLVGLTRPVQEYIPEFVGDGKEHVVIRRLAAAEMTRNQIPGVPALGLDGQRYGEASWGYGWWTMAGAERWPAYPSLPDGSFNHSGFGEVFVWGDPGHELVGVFLSLANRWGSGGEPECRDDLFANAVYAAVE